MSSSKVDQLLFANSEWYKVSIIGYYAQFLPLCSANQDYAEELTVLSRVHNFYYKLLVKLEYIDCSIRVTALLEYPYLVSTLKWLIYMFPELAVFFKHTGFTFTFIYKNQHDS